MTNPFKSLEDLADNHPNPEVRQAIGLALDTIQYLEDENSSLWDMLDEMRSSDIREHQDLLAAELMRLLPPSGGIPEA